MRYSFPVKSSATHCDNRCSLLFTGIGEGSGRNAYYLGPGKAQPFLRAREGLVVEAGSYCGTSAAVWASPGMLSRSETHLISAVC